MPGNNESTTSNFMIILLIIAIIKVIIVYSIGRSHGGKYQINIPTLQEWVMIIIIMLIIGFISKSLMPEELKNVLCQMN